jgi:hypothetical protein
MLMVAYYEGLEGEVLDALRATGVENYTQLTKVLGKGGSSGPHFGTHVWPKLNQLLFAAVDDAVARDALDAVRSLRDSVGREGVKAFVLPIESMT